MKMGLPVRRHVVKAVGGVLSNDFLLKVLTPLLTLCSFYVALVGNAIASQPQSAGHHQFRDVTRWVGIFEDPERDKWQKPDQIIRSLKLKPGQTVVDIGAGTGYFTRRFARAVGPTGKAIGLDIEPGMVAYMQHDAAKLGLRNYEAKLVKPDDPELPVHSADLIFFCDVLHHIENRPQYLKKLIPALKPDGRVAVVDFRKRAPSSIGPPPAIRISRDDVVKDFQKAGFKLVATHNFLPYQYFLEFAPDNSARGH